jgi:uncharacterized protein (TIGR00297 family)
MNKHETLIRKAIHLLTGLVLFGLTYVIEKQTLLMLIVGGTAFAFITFPLQRFRLLHKTANSSFGTLYYPVGILLSFLVLYDLPEYFFRISLLTLTISDTLANLIGVIKTGNGMFTIWHDKKSYFGVTGYVFSALVILHAFLPASVFADGWFVMLVLMLAVNFEIISRRGSDNFSIISGLSVFFFIHYHNALNFSFLTVTMLIMALGCIILYRLKILTRMGSLTAYILGFYLTGVLGLNWVVPVILFFITSVAFTKIHDAKARKRTKSDPRNAWQVTANIMWAVISSILYLITKNDVFVYLFIVFVAAVTADTWASELGPVFHKRSFSFSDMKMHEAGTTGGISLAGTMAAFAGALMISAVSWYLFFSIWSWPDILLLSFAGLLACFADTFLGAFVEEKIMKMPYFQKENSHSHLSPNDLVNLLGSLSAVLFYGLLRIIW